MGGDVVFDVKFRNTTVTLETSEATRLRQLVPALEQEFSLDPKTMKFLLPKGRGSCALLTDTTVGELGLRNGMKVKLLGSPAGAVQVVRQAKDDATVPDFDQEIQREAARRSGKHKPTDGVAVPAADQHRFHAFKAWDAPGLEPPPAEALALLHRLATDPAVRAIMRRHSWSVGLLSEMPPHGKVGVSPVCVLGVNINAGQEISLRLRTDDLQGFRRYDRICETLLHELAHMEHADHDVGFKTLNSQLRGEYTQLRQHATTGAVDGTGPATMDFAPVAGVAAPAGPQRLGGEAPHHATARAAARDAALQRAGVTGPAPTAVPANLIPAPSAADPVYAKGQTVLYRQRDGSFVPAKVVAVDLSLMPPAYSIELETGVRETEGNRLQPFGTIGEQAPSDDPVTAAKEAAARTLEI